MIVPNDLEKIRALVLNHHSKEKACFGTLASSDGVWFLTGDKLLDLCELAIMGLTICSKCRKDLDAGHCHNCARTAL